MSPSDRRPPPGSPYAIVPLETLDGVLVQVFLHGETIALCSGPDERTAVDAVVAQLTQPVSSTDAPNR